jgi:hypothetical protein
MNTRNSLIAITSLTATFVALCAAVFSVTGIAKLFAGAALSAAIMASALELGKVVSISFLYQYWKEIPRALKSYLSIAALVLMIITSAGIYGYLSSAYAKVAATPLQLSADIQATDGRIGSIEQDIKRKEDRLNQLISLRAQQETRLDQLVSRSTTGNNTTIRSAQSALTAADRNVTTLQNEISKLSEQRDSLRGITIGKQVEIETNGDIGTFVYIAKMFGVPLDVVVKWFTLVIVLVFDPLAVALVIAVNFLLKNKTEEKTLINNIENKNIIVSDEAFDKIQELIENPPEPTEALKQLLKDDEPYKVFIKEEPIEPKSEQVIVEEPKLHGAVNRNDPQYYLRGDFDWSKKHEWENDPIAVNYYNQRIAPNR